MPKSNSNYFDDTNDGGKTFTDVRICPGVKSYINFMEDSSGVRENMY